MFNFKAYRLKKLNYKLILAIVILAVLGVVFLKSATMKQESSNLVSKQLMGLSISAAAIILMSLVDYHWILKFYWVILIVAIGLLLVTRFFGVEWNNAKRWIEIPVAGQIQPAEFAKIFILLFFSMFLQKNQERINKPLFLLSCLVLLGIPLFFILEQPDLSTSIVIVFMFCIMIFAGGISYKWILGVLALAFPVVGILIYAANHSDSFSLLQGYQLSRITNWLNRDASLDSTYQQRNSVMAIGSGQVFGKGLFNDSVDSVKNGNFLSEADTDFIFAVVGEELGFIGCLIIIVLFLVIVIECLIIASHTKDLAGRLICVGMASLIAFQSFVNIGVATWLLPNTGLPLPFVSSGISSLLSLSLGMGIVINIGLQRSNEIQGGT